MKYALLNGNKVFRIDNTYSENSIECADNVEAGWLRTAKGFEPPPGSIAFAKSRKIQEINSLRSVKLEKPVLYAGNLFDSNSASLSNITAVISAIGVGIPLPSGFTWRTADNQNIVMNAAELVQLAGTMLNHVTTQYALSWAKKAELDTAVTLEDIQKVNW